MGAMVSAILLDVLGPILVLVGLGALMKWQFDVDLGTLSKLNIYLFVPAFVFDKVSTSKLSWADMGGVVTVTVVQVATLGLIVWSIGRALRVSRPTLAAVAMAVMFYNSGNYGIPLAELAYPTSSAGATSGKDGGAVQAFVLMTQNVLTFTLGLTIAGFAHTGVNLGSVLRILRLPMLPVLGMALLARWWVGLDAVNHHLPAIVAKPAGYLAAGLVPLALVTLGAQLASNPRWPQWRPIGFVLLLRLGFGPVQMALLLWGFHVLGVPALDLWGARGWPAELLILTAAVPTAVNTLLMTIELDGDVDLAADCVFWTTVFSCVTITGWLVVIRWWFG
jgi:malate permease and related proteins